MKPFLCLCLSCALILSLAGCAVKTRANAEYVTDVWQETPECEFFLAAPISLRMLLTASTDDGLHKTYVQETGDYEMSTDIFTAASLDDALRFLTGRDESELQPVSVERFPIDQYQYAWTAGADEGLLACSGTLFYDGTYYYALSIRCAAEKEKEYHDEFAHVIANTVLQGKDGF